MLADLPVRQIGALVYPGALPRPSSPSTARGSRARCRRCQKHEYPTLRLAWPPCLSGRSARTSRAHRHKRVGMRQACSKTSASQAVVRVVFAHLRRVVKVLPLCALVPRELLGQCQAIDAQARHLCDTHVFEVVPDASGKLLVNALPLECPLLALVLKLLDLDENMLALRRLSRGLDDLAPRHPASSPPAAEAARGRVSAAASFTQAQGSLHTEKPTTMGEVQRFGAPRPPVSHPKSDAIEGLWGA